MDTSRRANTFPSLAGKRVSCGRKTGGMFCAKDMSDKEKTNENKRGAITEKQQEITAWALREARSHHLGIKIFTVSNAIAEERYFSFTLYDVTEHIQFIGSITAYAVFAPACHRR